MLLEDAAAHARERNAGLVHLGGAEQPDVIGYCLLPAVQRIAAEAGNVVAAGAERIEGIEAVLLAVAVAAEQGVVIVCSWPRQGQAVWELQ